MFEQQKHPENNKGESALNSEICCNNKYIEKITTIVRVTFFQHYFSCK